MLRTGPGGPATDYCTCWVTDFINYCKTNNVPFDFISTHCYSGGSQSVGDVRPVVSGLQQARALMGNEIPFLVTEWSASYVQGSGRGGPVRQRPPDPLHRVANAVTVVSFRDFIRL
jgi:hypothetical protein